MTPNDLDVLIHFHVCPRRHPRQDAPAVREAIGYFLRDGILRESGEDFYETTEKGKAWVKMILRTPYPKQVWVDGAGNILG